MSGFGTVLLVTFLIIALLVALVAQGAIFLGIGYALYKLILGIISTADGVETLSQYDPDDPFPDGVSYHDSEW